MVGVGCRAPTSSTALLGRPISSSASRSAVSRRSVSSSSWRPPGNEISPGWRRRSSRRRVNTACSSPPSTYSGTSTAASMRPCTSSAAASPASRRTERSARASSVRERDPFDALVEHHLAVERAVHGALGGDHAQALDLLAAEPLGEPQHEPEARRATPLGGGVLARALAPADVPALARGVHLHRDRGARREACGEQLLRARADVVAAHVPMLVDDHVVRADPHDVAVSVFTSGGGFHPGQPPTPVIAAG